MMRLVIIFLLLSTSLHANIDSLDNVWKSSEHHDTIRLETINKLIWKYYLFSNPDSAFELSQQQYVFANITNQKKYAAMALNTQGISRVVKGEFKKAISLYNRSLNLYKEIKDLNGIAKSCNNLGMVYKEVGNHPKALKYYKKSLQIKEYLNDSKSLPSTLNNIGNIYYDTESYNQALEYYEKGLELRDKEDKIGLASSYNNIAGVYYSQALNTSDNKEQTQLLEKSKEYYIISKKLRENVKDEKGLASTLINIGLISNHKGEREQALTYFKQSEEIQRKIGDKPGLSFSLINIGSIYAQQNEHHKAIIFFKEAFELAQQSQSKIQMRDALKGIHESYGALGKFDLAYENVLLFNKLEKEINSEENKKAIIQQQAQHEFEKEQLKREHELKEKSRIEEEAINRRNNLQYSLIFLGILLLFGIILSLGFIRVSPTIAEGLIFFAFLILFEFALVFTEPYIEVYTKDEPMYNLLANSIMAIIIFPLHAVLERILKQRIVKR